jgi:hypothetical protein
VGQHPLDDGQPIYALDTSIWPRNDAETSPERGYYYSAARQSAGQPIVAGWSYAWLAQVSFTHDSWTAPLDVRRVPPHANAHTVAAAQIRALLEQQPAACPVPWCVFDAGYDPETVARELGDLDGERVAVLVRLRSGRCFYADPSPGPDGQVGRPRRPGAKFACADERTWWTPTAAHLEDHAQYGHVQVRAWAGVHAKSQNHPQKGSRRTLPTVRGTLVLVEVERLPHQTRIPKRLWLWWRGPGAPNLAVLWRAYVHRFDLKHTYRFCKQVLNWTTPRVRQPEQADRWSWLVLLAYTQLRLARRAIDIDIVKSGIDSCRERITPQFPNFHFQQIDVYNKYYNPHGACQPAEYKFPFADESFSFVVLGSVFIHMPPDDLEHYLSEVQRVLTKGGRCLITYFLLNEESSQLMATGNSTLDSRTCSAYTAAFLLWSRSRRLPMMSSGSEVYTRS